HQVEGLTRVLSGHQPHGLLRGESSRTHVGKHLVLVRSEQPHTGRPGQGLDEPVGVHGRLQQQSDLTSCGCQGFCHRLCPDRRTVDDVEVHVSVQECARRRSTHDLPFGYFLMARTGWVGSQPTAPASAAVWVGPPVPGPRSVSGPRARRRLPRRLHSPGGQPHRTRSVRASSGVIALTNTYWWPSSRGRSKNPRSPAFGGDSSPWERVPTASAAEPSTAHTRSARRCSPAGAVHKWTQGAVARSARPAQRSGAWWSTPFVSRVSSSGLSGVVKRAVRTGTPSVRSRWIPGRREAVEGT